jgi:Mrp family chromosome partitioning ATPase
LNAIGSARPADRHLPAFAEWDVEAERVEPRLVAIRQPHSNYCEEYRSLRTHILHRSQRQKLQSIVVASVNPSEGKTVTALNLSWLLAQTDGINALIIDSDLRLPSLTDYLGIEADKGLSDILSGRATLADSIIKLNPSGLHLLPGGEARSEIARRVPRKVALGLMGISALWGFPSPPEPEVVAQMQPAKSPGGSPGPPRIEEDASMFSLDLPRGSADPPGPAD